MLQGPCSSLKIILVWNWNIFKLNLKDQKQFFIIRNYVFNNII